MRSLLLLEQSLVDRCTYFSLSSNASPSFSHRGSPPWKPLDQTHEVLVSSRPCILQFMCSPHTAPRPSQSSSLTSCWLPLRRERFPFGLSMWNLYKLS